MITGLQDIYYNVENMARAVQFYTEVLNMKLIDTNPYWTSLDCGGIRIGLHSTEGHTIPRVPRDSHGANAGGTLTLRSTDAQVDHDMLKHLKVTVLGFHKEAWGTLVVFEDTEGNVLKLMQPA